MFYISVVLHKSQSFLVKAFHSDQHGSEKGSENGSKWSQSFLVKAFHSDGISQTKLLYHFMDSLNPF